MRKVGNYFIVLGITSVISFFVWAANFHCSCEDMYRYTGKVSRIAYDPPTSGQHYSTDPVYYIFMKEKLSGKTMRVNISIPLWGEMVVGKEVSFDLTNGQMNGYGNTSSFRENWYEHYKIQNVKKIN